MALTRPGDKYVPTLAEKEILYKPSKTSLSLRVVVITRNKDKFREFKSQLGNGYGVDVVQWVPNENQLLDAEAELMKVCTDIVNSLPTSPHFILREITRLSNQENHQDVTTLPLEALARLELQSVMHTSSLTCCKPQWTTPSSGGPVTEDKKLTGFTVRVYDRRTYGYITDHYDPAAPQLGFGWDALFVNAITGMTNEEFYAKYGKKSARQHAISDFIETYLRYQTARALRYHTLDVVRPIDFGKNYHSIVQFVKNEPHMSNPFVAEVGIQQLRNAMINEGMFFRAALSRPIGNYFSPPFSGLPLTAKKDAVEETIFMIHDMLHHLICDLICNVPATKKTFNVNSAWRSMSETCTMAFADMFYAKSLMKSGVDRSCVDKRIYPLFEAILRARQIPDFGQMELTAKIQFIKEVLFASARYGLLGDESGWKKLLEQEGVLSDEDRQTLQTYTDHFGKVFAGDIAWTVANYNNIQANMSALTEWIEAVGLDTFRASQIPLLSDVCRDLESQGDLVENYDDMIEPLFNYVFEKRIKPHLEKTSVEFDSDEQIQSRAFRRFLIGQSSLFFRYPVPYNLGKIKTDIFERLRDSRLFSSLEQEAILKQLRQYILGIEGMRLMSREEALNAMDCVTVFPPVYLANFKLQKQGATIDECVTSYIRSYPSDEKQKISPLRSNTLFAIQIEEKLCEGEVTTLTFKISQK